MAGCERAQHKALGEWVAHQRAHKTKGSKRMTPARIEELNSIPGWLWDARKKGKCPPSWPILCKKTLKKIRTANHIMSADRVAEVSAQVDEVKGVMQENVSKVSTHSASLLGWVKLF